MPALLSFVCLAAAAAAAVHESLSSLPRGWRPYTAQAVSSATPLKLYVALAYRNLDSLEARLAAVSSPGAADYGRYIDVDEQTAVFGPSEASAEKVVSWLQSSAGVRDVSHEATTGIVSFTTTVGAANALLDAQYALYTDGEAVKLRTTSYSIPDDLEEAVDLIYPTTFFGNMRANRAVPTRTENHDPPTRRQLNPACETTVVLDNQTFPLIGPQCLKELYNISDYKPDPSAGSTIAFGSFLNQSASYSDLAKFENIWSLPSQNFTVLALINGGVNNQDPATEEDGEANLDVQNIIGLVDGLPVGEYITGGLPPFIPDVLTPNKSTESNEPYVPYYTYLLSQPNSHLPHVITNSYGDDEDTVPPRYAARVCAMIGLMGLRGRTILVSSGDMGTGAACRSNRPGHAVQFTPVFPATCPWVTSVGGTQFYSPEWAWNASSGGFSFYFSQPWYQREALETYLTRYINPEAKVYYASNGYVDFSGRGFPDMAAHSLFPDYLTVENGTAYPNGGTSAASPVVASVIALLNDARFRAGKPAIGFANPLLYALAAAKNPGITDITHGGSKGCTGVDLQTGETVPGAGVIPYASWNATVGWDPVTGLGTPDFGELKEAVLRVC